MDLGLVSIIIPVFNVEKYLQSAVESSVRQTYQNIEIVLVDDGSTDSSGKICDDMAAKYDNVIVFHKENGGLSDARNYGVDYSNGDYIMFLDSDDCVSENIVSVLMDGMKVKKSDIAACELTRFKDENKISFELSGSMIELNHDEAIIDFLYQKNISTSACAKIYKREMLEKIRFIKGQRFEDNDFLFRAIRESEKVVVFFSKLYAYRYRMNSITTNGFSEKDFDIIKIGKKILEASVNMSDAIKKAALTYQCTNSYRILLTATPDYYNYETYIECKRYLEKNVLKVVFDNNSRIRIRVGLLMYYCHIPIKILRRVRRK